MQVSSVSFDVPAALRRQHALAAPARLYGRPRELCQLLTDWEERRAFEGPAVVERKHDGIRAIMLPGRGIFTRGSMPIAALDDLEDERAAIAAAYGAPVMLDGEWQEPGGLERTHAVLMDRGRTVATGGVTLFDAVPMATWELGHDTTPLAERRARLADAIARAGTTRLRFVAGVEVEDCRLAVQAAEAVWAAGGEGVVVKRLASPYVRARTQDWLRIKRRMIAHCAIIGIEAGPRGGRRLVVDHAGREVRVALVAARFRHLSDADLVGRTAVVAAMGETATGSLREPRLKDIRIIG